MTPSSLIQPLEFFSGLVVGFNVVHLIRHGTPYFEGDTALERGWVWLPPTKPVHDRSMLAVESMLIKAAGGRWHVARGCHFHVGKGWAPEERLLQPGLTVSPKLSPDEIRDAWSLPKDYPKHILDTIEVIDGWEMIGFTDKDIHAGYLEAKKNGYLLNPTPRKKRVAKVDPIIALLRDGGLLG